VGFSEPVAFWRAFERLMLIDLLWRLTPFGKRQFEVKRKGEVQEREEMEERESGGWPKMRECGGLVKGSRVTGRGKRRRREGEMMEALSRLRQTRASAVAAAIRIFLGLTFLATGVMKFAVPELRVAFSGQLTAAGIPFHALNLWLVPAVEMVVGVALLLGFFTRVAALVAMGLMVVASYVHLVAKDPALFPLQPKEPIIPAMVIVLCVYHVWRGSGSWSLDIRGKAAEQRGNG
jgi:putative oxidoreductase